MRFGNRDKRKTTSRNEIVAKRYSIQTYTFHFAQILVFILRDPVCCAALIGLRFWSNFHWYKYRFIISKNEYKLNIIKVLARAKHFHWQWQIYQINDTDKHKQTITILCPTESVIDSYDNEHLKPIPGRSQSEHSIDCSKTVWMRKLIYSFYYSLRKIEFKNIPSVAMPSWHRQKKPFKQINNGCYKCRVITLRENNGIFLNEQFSSIPNKFSIWIIGIIPLDDCGRSKLHKLFKHRSEKRIHSK